VPAQQRLQRDEERCPPLPGEDAAGGGEQGPVERCEPGTAGLAARDPELVSDHQDLQVLGAVISAGRTSRRVSTRAASESSNSIGRWCGVPGHGANAGFRAPHVYLADQVVVLAGSPSRVAACLPVPLGRRRG